MSASLGKRKEREGEGAEEKIHGSTIFVSNLPYSATSTDIKTLFSDIGPVRSAFVVLDSASGTSKGVGYVSFAIREDAQAAHDTVNGGEGLILDGRKLRVDWAGSKPHKDGKEREAKEVSQKAGAKPAHHPKHTPLAGPSDPFAIRTIVISGLPAGIDSKALWKKVRKYDGAEKVEWPVSINGSEDPSTAHVLFSTPSTAQEAVNRLHAHVYKGALLSVTLKKRLDGLAKTSQKAGTSKAAAADPAKAKAAAKPSGPAPTRASRLIVRNLPFDITEQDLRAVFLPYGPIYSVHIPTQDVPKTEEDDEAEGVATEKAEAKAHPRAKGYAFVWMLSKKDAEKAVEGANGVRVRAGMADGMVRDKQKRKKLRREEAKLKQREKERKAREAGTKVKEEEGEDNNGESEDEKKHEGEEHASEGEDESATAERVIAVDWALSKDKWEEAKAKLQEEAEQEVKEEEESEDENESDEGKASGSDSEGSHIGLHEYSDEDDEEGSGDEGMDVDDEEQNPGKPQLPPPETGTTLFVRNVPFEGTEDELRTVFRAFGPLRYARITMDHETGRSRGTGFVCFWNKEDADKAIEQSQLLHEETTGAQAPAPKKNPFKLPSLLTPDPSASVAQNLVLHGRTMDVVRAVTRDEAGKLKEEGERQREKADKRHLYLLREGTILPNTPAAEGLSPTELEKRTQSFSARKALLRSNPSLYVSRTRLSIRQIPIFATERMLKRLAIHAVRAFEGEVKEGARAPLTEDELAEPPADAEDASAEADKAKDKGEGKDKTKHTGRSTGVRQAKIVRQQDRVDPVTGKGRSRGYGFVEMERHADALRVLRWANNNPEVGKLFEQWWRDELQDLLKAEKKKPKREEGRLERIKAELEQASSKKSKGTLVVEFSIENVQVVKRRDARQQEQRNTPHERREKKSSKPAMKKEQPDEDSPPQKKRRVSDASDSSAVKQEKAVNKIGSLIGRKRKERRAKKKP